MAEQDESLLDTLDDELDELEDAADEDEVNELEDMLKYDDVKEVAKVLHSEKMHSLLGKIEEANAAQEAAKAAGRDCNEIMGVDSPEYQLLLESNAIVQDIDKDITKVHKFIKDHYAVRFPELEQFIFDPITYAKVVQSVGNSLDVSSISKAKLAHLVQPHTIMIIQTTGSTTQGKPLTPDQLATVSAACEEVLTLDEAKQFVLEFVQSKMSRLAPNTSAIVGTRIASQLIGAAGGLVALSKLSSNVIRMLGKSRKALGGFAATTQVFHAGHLLQCDLVQQQPHAWKRKTVSLVANKVTLAIRTDCDRSVRNAAYGESIREDIQKKIAQWKEPAPGRANKALPAPRDAPKKKRAGAKVQRIKAKWQQTTISKEMNRMQFGVLEEDGYMEGRSYTSLKKDLHRINVQAETKVRAKKPRLDPRVEQLKRSRDSQSTGLATSLAFTPVQGMELGSLDFVPERDESKSKYFGSSAGFRSGIASTAGSFVGSTVAASTPSKE